MKLYVEKREVRANGGVLLDGYAVVDEAGHLASLVVPTRYDADKIRRELVEEISDYEIGTGKRPR